MMFDGEYIGDVSKMSVSGVYAIEYECGMFYVGKSVNIFRRFVDHVETAYVKCHYFKKDHYYLHRFTWPPNLLRMTLAAINKETITIHIIDIDINNEFLRIKAMCNENMLNITHNSYRLTAINHRQTLKDKVNKITKRKYE